MSKYECILYDEEGNRKNVKLEFESEKDLDLYAKENNLKIACTKILKENKIKRLKNKDLSIICNQLGMMISSGCEITNSLNTIRSNCNSKINSILKIINNNLKKGNSISESFQNTYVFSNFFINMIRAGEESGKLDEIFINLSNYYKKEYEFKNKLLTAMIYPLLLIIVSSLVILFMLIYAVPNFQKSFLQNNNNLPVSTKILINISMFIRNYYEIIVVILLILVLYILNKIKTSNEFRYFIDKKIFKFRYSKKIVQNIEISKFIRCFYILSSNGIHITSSLDISSKVIGNKYMYEKIEISKENIKKGNSITDSFKLANIFPELVISILKVGEETGNIDKCLKSITENYDRNLESFVNKIVKIIEPIIISIMGIVIGAIVISMMIPIFDAVTSFQ
ncbi:type II secretion system F family protein [Paraclostridium bifermentans]|uniref:type II secretion system F family protein n=1 Tax=Paraclostridium bifermentans TaxID=1490 RepID=UPI00359C2A4D